MSSKYLAFIYPHLLSRGASLAPHGPRCRTSLHPPLRLTRLSFLCPHVSSSLPASVNLLLHLSIYTISTSMSMLLTCGCLQFRTPCHRAMHCLANLSTRPTSPMSNQDQSCTQSLHNTSNHLSVLSFLRPNPSLRLNSKDPVSACSLYLVAVSS